MKKLLTHPLTIVASIVVGIYLGLKFETAAMSLKPVSDIYVSLLKMVALPLMFSAIIFSISRLLSDGNANALISRFFGTFVVTLPVIIIIAFLVSTIFSPGSNISPESRAALGEVIGAAERLGDGELIYLYREGVMEADQSFLSIIQGMIPNNIFEALATGEALHVLMFALFFGAALGSLGAQVRGTVSSYLDGIYNTCLLMTQWLVYPLPIALLAAISSQLASAGLEPLILMGEFLLCIAAAALVCLVLSIIVLWIRSRSSLGSVLIAMQSPFAIAFASRNGMASIPAIMNGLNNLRFSKLEIELAVPLSISLVRLGQTMFYIIATLFIVEIYGRELLPAEYLLVGIACFLAGLASSGATGVVALSMVGIACGYLSLPFEAVLILFVAVDVVSDTLRTLVSVLGNMAFSSVVCTRPEVEKATKTV